MIVMQEELQKKYAQTFSKNAIQKLYDSIYFYPSNILYEKNGNILTVDKLISVMGYAIKTIEALSLNERTEELSKALMVFKSTDLLLTNYSQNKPLNKFLHIANDVLASFVKNSAATDKAKQKNDIILF